MNYTRNLLSKDFKRDSLGNISSYKMHDVVHDLIRSVMEDEFHNMEAKKLIDHLLR